LNLQFDGKLLL